jgi:hypothetical protein
MDLVLSGGEDQLLSSLQFKLPPSASYIQERRLVSWYPSGASTFSPNGVREARFVITGDSWLDPASLRINMKIRNNSGQPIQLASSAHALCRRMRIMVGGVTLEDIDSYSRNAQLFQRMLQTPDMCMNDGIESGTVFQGGITNGTLPRERPIVIEPGTVTLSLTPLLGFLSCKKLIPLRYLGGLQLYIEFADFDDALSVESPGRTCGRTACLEGCHRSSGQCAGIELCFSFDLLASPRVFLQHNNHTTPGRASRGEPDHVGCACPISPKCSFCNF